jgi:hypothetical protein
MFSDLKHIQAEESLFVLDWSCSPVDIALWLSRGEDDPIIWSFITSILFIACDLNVMGLQCILKFLSAIPFPFLARSQFPIHHKMLQTQVNESEFKLITKKGCSWRHIKHHKLQVKMCLGLIDLEVPRTSFLMLRNGMRSIIAFPTISLSTRMVPPLNLFRCVFFS